MHNQKQENGATAKEAHGSQRSWHTWTRRQVLPAALLCSGAFLAMMTQKSLGPALLDLQMRTGSSLEQASWIISVRAMGSLAGALLLGKVIEHRSRWLQYSAACLFGGLFYALAPWFTNFPAQLATFLLYGVCLTFMLTGGQLTIYLLWGNKKDSVSWQGVYQLFSSLGGLVGPLVVEPFLVEVPDYLHTNTTGATQINIVSGSNSIPNTVPEAKVMWGFLIESALCFVLFIFCILAYLGLNGIYVYGQQKGSETLQSSHKVPKGYVGVQFAIVLLLFLFYISQSVYLRSYSNYVATFSVNYLNFSKSQSAMLTSAYFAASFISKAFVIILVRFVQIEVQLFSGLTLCCVSSYCLCLFINNHSSIIWVFSILLNIGTSISVAVLLAWTDKHIGLKGFIGVLYSISGAIGEIAFASSIGYLMEGWTYMSFMYITAGATTFCLVTMVTLQLLGSAYKRGLSDTEREPLIKTH